MLQFGILQNKTESFNWSNKWRNNDVNILEVVGHKYLPREPFTMSVFTLTKDIADDFFMVTSFILWSNVAVRSAFGSEQNNEEELAADFQRPGWHRTS